MTIVALHVRPWVIEMRPRDADATVFVDDVLMIAKGRKFLGHMSMP